MERIIKAVEKAREEQAIFEETNENLYQSNKARFSARPKVRNFDIGRKITYTQTKVLNIPQDILRKNRIISGLSENSVLSAYKVLRTQVSQALKSNSWNSIAITSPGMGEGKTLTAVNLAISLARDVNHTVLLVDLDLRRPNVAASFGFKPAYGLIDYLNSDIPLPEILVNPGVERLVILPGRQVPVQSSEMLLLPKMAQLVRELKSRYPGRLILFDMPPIYAADDVLVSSTYVDTFILVIEEGKTKQDEVLSAMQLLKETHFLGTVLNKSKAKTDIVY